MTNEETQIVLAETVYGDLQELAELLNKAVSDDEMYQASIQTLQNIHSQITAMKTAFKAAMETAIGQRNDLAAELEGIDQILRMDEMALVEDEAAERIENFRSDLQTRVRELVKLQNAALSGDTDHPVVEDIWESAREAIMDDPYWMDDYWPDLSEQEQMNKAIDMTVVTLSNLMGMKEQGVDAKLRGVARALVLESASDEFMAMIRNQELRDLVQAMIAALPDENRDYTK